MEHNHPGPGHVDRLIEWTGERCVPWTGDQQVVYEHYHRYLWAQRLVEGKRVLDLASGEGYGSALLAERAASVVGLEIDPAAVAHSSATHTAPNLAFVEGSMLDLSRYEDGAFDVVTCFEALEHVVEHDELVTGVRRVLAPGGVFLTSTPDRLMYTEHLHQHNPHHVRELSQDEFRDLLERYFPNVGIWGQAVAVGSLLRGTGGATSGPVQVIALAPDGEEWREQQAYPPSYFIAAASAAPIPELPEQSVLVDTELTLVRGAQRAANDALAAQAGLQEAHDAQAAAAAAALDAAVTEKAEAAAAYEAQIERMQAELARLHEHLAEQDRREEAARAQLARDADEIAAAQARVGELDAQVAALTARAAELEAERDAALDRARHPLRSALGRRSRSDG